MKIRDYGATVGCYSDIEITDDEIRVQHFEDTTKIQAENKAIKAAFTPQDLTNKETGWRMVGRIPMTKYMEIMRKNQLMHDGETLKEEANKEIREFLNDPDFKDFNLGGKV